ncbi:MAG: NAD(P)-dependent oxidoreductase [Nitrosopumilaceae archaeon]|nr:NAD(P)-dependent oxidoreductase [Nitrosopumilaceae archaeon]
MGNKKRREAIKRLLKMEKDALKRVGIVGTGMLGNAVGLNLLDKGYTLTVFNRTQEKTTGLEKKGAKVAASPKEVAQESDLVFTVVKDADSVKSVSFEKNGIIFGKHDKLIVCDMSTINPFDSKNIAQKFLEQGIPMLDTPVMGGPNVAITGNLVMMTGGDRVSFEKCKDVFKVIANKVFHLGENGTAHAVKLAMNLQITMLALALSEGITLVRAAKIEPKIFLEILNSTYFRTGMSENKAFKMVQGKFDATFTLENLKKDINTIEETSKTFGLTLPMVQRAKEIYENAVKDGFGSLDYTGILAYIKKINEEK